MMGASAQTAAGACGDPELSVLPSPVSPWKGAPLRVMVVIEKPIQGVLSLIAPDGSVAAKSPERHGGPPYFWFAEVAQPVAGDWHAMLVPEQTAGCGTIDTSGQIRYSGSETMY